MPARRKRTARAPRAVPLDPALEDARPTDIVIPIMGDTGAGKSVFINRLLEHIGDHRMCVKVGNCLESCTFDLDSIVISDQIHGKGVTCKFVHLTNEYRLVIVDTPGFDNSSPAAPDFYILKRIAKWLEEALKRKMILGGVIYLHDMSQDRASRTAQTNLSMLSHLCPEATLDKVVLVTSKWDRQGNRDFAGREELLKTNHWRDMIRMGATVMRLDPGTPGGGENASAWAVVSRVLQRLDRRLNQRPTANERRGRVGKHVVHEARESEADNDPGLVRIREETEQPRATREGMKSKRMSFFWRVKRFNVFRRSPTVVARPSAAAHPI